MVLSRLQVLFLSVLGKEALLTVLILARIVSVAQTPDNPYLPSSMPDRIILNVTVDPATSVAANWRTAETVTESYAEIAVAEADPRFVAKAKRLTARTERLAWEGTPTANYHSVIFENLQPATKYAYRVGQGTQWSEWFHFTTAGKPGEKMSFIYFGDVQVNIRSMWSRVIREAFAKAPDARLMMYAGDLINKANRDVEWGDWFAAGSFMHSMIPAFPTPGNHDHFDGPDGKNTTSVFWRPQFTLPENGPAGLEETCYYTDIQGVRFISLNSDQIEESDEYLTKQTVWLEKVLQNNPSRWTCITFHHPVYSPKSTRDNKRLREAFKPLFDKYKVDLVLQGHDHTYARGMAKIPMQQAGAVSGTMYVVSVSGPKMTDSNVAKLPWMDRSAIYTQLYHVVTIEGDKLNFESYTATGELYDSFDLIKQKGKINKLVNKIPQEVAERN
ncbi:metallophosphoesterase family protein [Larkinella harenae]